MRPLVHGLMVRLPLGGRRGIAGSASIRRRRALFGMIMMDDDDDDDDDDGFEASPKQVPPTSIYLG